MKNKTEFIVGAINDTQATIRAIDVKVGALLAGLLLPLVSLGKIWSHLVNISPNSCPIFTSVLGILFFLIWIITVVALIRTISAIDNPSIHIVNSNNFNGAFYGGGHYDFGVLDVLFNQKKVKANKDVRAFSLDYPSTEEEIEGELAFEHLKLIYIREIKLHRLNAALVLASIWVIIGISIYTYSKLG